MIKIEQKIELVEEKQEKAGLKFKKYKGVFSYFNRKLTRLESWWLKRPSLNVK